MCVYYSNILAFTFQFLSYYFQPYYPIDLNESLNFFIFGRNEFKNKGMDVFIKSLGKLNEEMKFGRDIHL